MTLPLRKTILALSSAAAFLAPLSIGFAETIKIASIDPFSGPMAAVGANVMRTFQISASLANREKWAGENTIEIVGFDNKAARKSR